jgi:hypothetical protein
VLFLTWHRLLELRTTESPYLATKT